VIVLISLTDVAYRLLNPRAERYESGFRTVSDPDSAS
jgi:hypothetical protein